MVTHPNAPGIVAKISNTSLGVVIKASHCDITPEAKKILSNARRESGSFAGIQLTGGDIPCIGWLDSYNLALDPKDVEIGRDCDKSTLDKMNLVETKDMAFPIGFVNYVHQEIISNNKIN